MSDNGNMGEALALSVTKGDKAKLRENALAGPVYFNFTFPSVSRSPSLPAYWSAHRDYLLRSTLLMESMWAGAIARAATKVGSTRWLVRDSDDSDRKTKQAQELLQNTDDGEGLNATAVKWLLDFLLTDNGCFGEIVRAGNMPGGKVLGLFHLDSCRCTRTGDPRYPVVYTDLENKSHALEWWQVFYFSDIPLPDASMYGVGRCAALRCYPQIEKMANMETYIDEKLSGEWKGIDLIPGMSAQQLRDAINNADEDRKQKGFVVYRGRILIPLLNMDAAPDVKTIGFSDMPDGFESDQERQHYARIIANNIGINVQEIVPLSGQGLGTGTQSIVLDEAAKGMGIQIFYTFLAHRLTSKKYRIFADTTGFEWDANDLADQKAEAEVRKLRAERRSIMLMGGEIDRMQSLQLAVDEDDAPAIFLPTGDQTPGGQLLDTEKPEEAESPAESQAGATPVQTPSAQLQPVAQFGTKAAKPDKLEQDILNRIEAARTLAREAMRHG